MAFTFDGPNLLITLPSGVAGVGQLDALEMYSAWKVWAQIGDNAKYPAAFRTIGGDPLSSIINAGAYFFLRNDFGWRVKPAEENVNYYLTGNLAAQDPTLPILIQTIGTYTTAIFGLQPVTQGVTPEMKEQLEYASFVNGVWVDQLNGQSGTSGTIGNAQTPVSNFPDANLILAARGLPRTFYVKGDATLDTGDDVQFASIIGENAARSTLTINAGADTLGADIAECSVQGNLDGGAILRNCVVSNLNYVNGFVYNCMLNPGTITLGGTETAHFLNCYSGIPGQGTPIISWLVSQNTPLAMRNYQGGIELRDKTGDSSVSVDLGSGQVKIDVSCVDGDIVVRGDGKVFDTLGNHMMTGVYNGNLIVRNEATYGEHIHDLWQDKGLDPDNPTSYSDDGTTTTKTSGGVTLQITDSSVTRV